MRPMNSFAELHRMRSLTLALLVIVGTAVCYPAVLKGVQTGTFTMNNSVDTTTSLTVSVASVDTTRSFLIFQTRSNGDRPGNSYLRGRIASPTTLEFVRISGEGAPGVPMDIRWYVVEFTSGVKVQRGTVTQPSTTIDVTLPTPVAAVNQAFVLWSKTAGPAELTFNANDPIVGELTSTTNLQFRVNAFHGIVHTIWWEVIEYTNAADITVQKATMSLTGGSLSTTATLGTAVNTSNTFVIAGYTTNGDGADIGARMIRAQLTNSTTVAVDRSLAGDADDISEVLCQVVELKDGTTVQRGSAAFSGGVAQAIVPISSVTVNRTVAFASVESGGGQTLGRSPYVIDDVLGVGTVTLAVSSTQLTLDRNSTVESADIGWFVVQFSTGPVPVQLVSFRGMVTAVHTVVLEWSTVSEVNNYGFTVERRLDRDGEFSELTNSFVPGHGSTLQPQQYTFTDLSVSTGQWSYRLKQIDLDGTVHYTDAVSVDVLTDVKDQNKPTAFALEQNYPNPFNPSTVVSYQLPVVSGQSPAPSGVEGPVVSLKVFDILGREVAVLVNERQAPGSYSVTFNANGLASGVYLYRLTAGTFSETRMLTLLK